MIKIKFPVTLWTVLLGSKPYVRYNTLDRMSGLETVCPLQGFQGEPHFSPLTLLFSKSTRKPTKELSKVS
jgi:hypothetical protein